MKRIFLSLALLCAFVALCAPQAHASMTTAYLVMNDKNQEVAAPLIAYLKDSGTAYEVVKPENIATVQDKEYFIVIGSPKDNDAIAALAKSSLSPKQWENASKMGKSGPVIASVGKSQALFLFSDYSLRSMVTGSKDMWTETFSTWYDIPLSITHIIGY